MLTQTIVFFFCFLAAFVILIRAISKIKSPMGKSVTSLSICILIWSASYLLFSLNWVSVSWTTLIAITYICSTVAAAIQFVFALSYTNRTHWAVRIVVPVLAILPFLMQTYFSAMSLMELLPKDQPFSLFDSFALTGFGAQFNAVFVYNLQIVSILILIEVFVQRPRKPFLQSGIILAGSILSLTTHLAVNIGFGPGVGVNPLVVTYTLILIGFAYTLLNPRLSNIVPMRRDTIVEWMDDGWMIIDTRNKIVDLNPSAEAMIGMPFNKVYGQPISLILADWSSMVEGVGNVRELEMRKSIKIQDNWRYLNVRILPLQNKSLGRSGYLIVWRDITDRKVVEEARQRARDEMFILLNAISSAASNSMNLDEFLSEIIYQIIHPFQSQAVGFFLLDQNSPKDDQRMTLSSYFGLPSEGAKQMAHVSVQATIFDWVKQNRKPLLIDDVPNDPRVPSAMRESGFTSILTAPLITHLGDGNKFLGCMCLGRKEGPVYSQAETIRLTTISDQIANLIDSDRRRQLAIALSERQRLLRDLHDSVSQKLYGLVALTEAAQAAMEAGSKVTPSQVLARIGENARQAVKEMRLFLYEIQPIDLEEGLVSVLHHRLAAVEGRADVRARLLADEDISLAKDKEIALYFIAQEALNNILRHAHAKSVTVTLKQTRQNVILEVVDDGRGFDPKKVDPGGLGLRNIKERASQINGKLQIVSKPGGGTKIKVTVSRERIPVRLVNRQKQ